MYKTGSHSSARSRLEPMCSPLALPEHHLLRTSTQCCVHGPAGVQVISWVGDMLTCLTLCSSVASVGRLGFILWVTSSGRPFLAPTSRLNPPLYVLTASCSYSCYSIYQPLFSHKSMYRSHQTMKLTKFIVRSPTFGMVLINGPSVNIC